MIIESKDPEATSSVAYRAAELEQCAAVLIPYSGHFQWPLWEAHLEEAFGSTQGRKKRLGETCEPLLQNSGKTQEA